MAGSSSSPLLPLLAALVVGAGAGFLGGRLAVPEGAPGGGEPTSLAATRLEERLGALERELGTLDARVRELSVAPVPAPAEPAPMAAAPALDPELVERVEQLARAVDEGGLPADEGAALSLVESVLAQIRAREEAERDAARAAARAERIDERLAELQEELGLASYQVDEMRTLFNESGAKLSAAFESELRGTGEMVDVLREVRDTNDQRLAEILSPSQLAGYEAAGGMGFGPRITRFGRGPGGGDGDG